MCNILRQTCAVTSHMELPMKNTPPGWPRISASVYYDDPSAAIDWLCKAFGFELRLRVDDDAGRIVHSELTFGDGLIMVGGTEAVKEERASYQHLFRSPRGLGNINTQNLCIFVDDVDAHCAVARAAGGEIFRELSTSDYGDDYWSDRTYGVLDPEGHHWWFMQRMRNPGEK